MRKKVGIGYMKKWIYLISIYFFCVIGAHTVKADIIWEPEDSFYKNHSDECTYVGRKFIANGPDGIVLVYKNPESSKVKVRWQNGEKVWIDYTYQDADGITWGISKKLGWAPMDYMDPVYDNIAFQEEFEAEIKKEEGLLDEQYIQNEIYFWEYPGSKDFFLVSPKDFEENLPTYQAVFVDEQGKSWGYVNYYYGYRDTWICLDQPTDDINQLYPNGLPKRGEQTVERKFEGERIEPNSNHNLIIFVGLLVMGVVLITGLLLIVWRRK